MFEYHTLHDHMPLPSPSTCTWCVCLAMQKMVISVDINITSRQCDNDWCTTNRQIYCIEWSLQIYWPNYLVKWRPPKVSHFGYLESLQLQKGRRYSTDQQTKSPVSSKIKALNLKRKDACNTTTHSMAFTETQWNVLFVNTFEHFKYSPSSITTP